MLPWNKLWNEYEVFAFTAIWRPFLPQPYTLHIFTPSRILKSSRPWKSQSCKSAQWCGFLFWVKATSLTQCLAGQDYPHHPSSYRQSSNVRADVTSLIWILVWMTKYQLDVSLSSCKSCGISNMWCLYGTCFLSRSLSLFISLSLSIQYIYQIWPSRDRKIERERDLSDILFTIFTTHKYSVYIYIYIHVCIYVFDCICYLFAYLRYIAPPDFWKVTCSLPASPDETSETSERRAFFRTCNAPI